MRQLVRRAASGGHVIRRVALGVLVVSVPLATLGGGATAAAQARSGDRSVIVIVIGADPKQTLRPQGGRAEPYDTVLRRYDTLGLNLALLSTVQGRYDRQQALIELSQGSRQPRSLHGSDEDDEPMVLEVSGESGVVRGWDRAEARAQQASATLRPGALVAAVPGGATYVGVGGSDSSAAIAASDRDGRVRRVSLGGERDLAANAVAAAKNSRLVVVGVPLGDRWLNVVRSVLRDRSPGQLVLTINLPATVDRETVLAPAPTRFYTQTALGLRSDEPGGRQLTSATTRQPGLTAMIDVAPTILDHLGIDAPEVMRGHVVDSEGERDVERLESTRRRWSDVRDGRQEGSFRQLGTLAFLVAVVVGIARGARRGLRHALRLFGLGALWWPTAALAVAAFEPRAASTEALLIAGSAFVLAELTSRLLPWPRAPIAPAVIGLVLLFVDLGGGGGLLTRSVLSPSILSGNRFYGFSNEIEPVLPVLALAGLAAWAGWSSPSRRVLVGATAAAGLALAALVGLGRLGADVGGVITVAAAMAVAGVHLSERRLDRRTVLVLAALPVVALLLLIGADLVAGSDSHLSNNLQRAGGFEELWELVSRRFELSWREFTDPGNAGSFAVAVLAVVYFLRNRSVLLPRLPGVAWEAALLGGLAGGIAGALTNDSGPVLFTNAVLALAAVVAYLAGQSPESERETVRTPGGTRTVP